VNLQEFVRQYDGKHLDWDGQFGAQCVDEARFYFREVCGLEKQPAGVIGARDFYLNFDRDQVLKENFIRIPNTPDLLPLPGDVVVWDKSPRNPYGHVAVFVRGDVRAFDSFDQNLPTGSPCHLVHHTYSNVLGFLRPRKEAACG
jgi:N-acetylmuramoyl-L-alanine amidase